MGWKCRPLIITGEIKYLIFLSFLLSCNNDPEKPGTRKTKDNAIIQAAIGQDSASASVDDPYKSGQDTVLLNTIMDKIFGFPEVEETERQIRKRTRGAHGVAIFVQEGVGRYGSSYVFRVGDNSHEDRYESIYDFVFDKKTGQISVYDAATGSVIPLEDWRKMNK